MEELKKRFFQKEEQPKSGFARNFEFWKDFDWFEKPLFETLEIQGFSIFSPKEDFQKNSSPNFLFFDFLFLGWG